MRFDYWLVGLGWAEACISHQDTSFRPTASWLDDALTDLLLAVESLLAGAELSRCSWDEEPGEFRWIFEQSEAGVKLRILWFDRLWGNEPDEAGVVRFSATLPLAELAKAIVDGTARARRRYGGEEYQRRWGMPFPQELLVSIRARLSG